MAPLFDVLTRADSALSSANLTIREQARLAENPLDLRWRAIFPKVPTDDILVSQLSTVDFRPIAAYREWNADGREIPEKLGPIVSAEMLPITATKHIDERRMQRLRSRAGNLPQLIDRGIIKDVNTWATALADAVDRRIEAAAFQVWATNSFIVMDPKTGSTVAAARGIAAARYITEATIWSGAVNAYDRLVFHIGEAQRLLGSVGPIRMRRLTWNQVVLDAPTGPNGLRPTSANVGDRIREEGYEVTIVIDERTHDAFTDGGSATTATNYVPTGKVLFAPAGGVVGSTYFADVSRAYDYISGAGSRANSNDFVVWHSQQNDGKTLKIEAEAIALPLTDEGKTYVVDALV